MFWRVKDYFGSVCDANMIGVKNNLFFLLILLLFLPALLYCGEPRGRLLFIIIVWL